MLLTMLVPYFIVHIMFLKIFHLLLASFVTLVAGALILASERVKVQ